MKCKLLKVCIVCVQLYILVYSIVYIVWCVVTELNEVGISDHGEKIISLLRSFVVEVNNE